MQNSKQNFNLQKISEAKHLSQVLDISGDIEKQYKNLLKYIHPDICKLDLASEATSNLIKLKDVFFNFYTINDESGDFKTNEIEVHYYENNDKLISLNIGNIKKIKKSEDVFFKKYLPKTILTNGQITKMIFHERSLQLSKVNYLEEKHVLWVLSRILEYCCFLEKYGYVHLGLSLENIFIMPENHGIQITTFYYLTKIGHHIDSINGRYVSFYPDSLFNEKIAYTKYDLVLAKKIAISLLGDKTGIGNSLKNKINNKFFDFLKKKHENAKLCYEEFRELIKNNYKSEFHILNI